MAKVAVASTDGIAINEHFGRSKQFWIYEVDETGAYTLLECRENHSDGANQSNHPASGAAELLADVEVVLAIQIGPGAEGELRSKGVLALPVSGAIEKALTAYGKRGKFLKSGIQRSVSGFQPSGGSGCCGGSQGCGNRRI